MSLMPPLFLNIRNIIFVSHLCLAWFQVTFRSEILKLYENESINTNHFNPNIFLIPNTSLKSNVGYHQFLSGHLIKAAYKAAYNYEFIGPLLLPDVLRLR